MAKHNQKPADNSTLDNTPADPQPDTNATDFITVRLPMSGSVLKYKDWAANVADLPPDAIAYLLENGFTQSLTDAAAFSKDFKKDKSESELLAAAKDARDKKYANIIAGTVGSRGPGAPRVVGIDKIIKEVAIGTLKDACAAAKKPWPQKAAEQQVLIDKYLAKHGETARAEAERRMNEKPVVDMTGILD